jgi:hypothetical protein
MWRSERVAAGIIGAALPISGLAARPDLHFDRHTGGGQSLGRQPRVVKQHLTTGHMDQLAWQTGLDVIE